MPSYDLTEEIGAPMYEGLLKLRENFKKFGWTGAKTNRYMSDRSKIVIEAKDVSGRTHWFQVAKDGCISPCITYIRCAHI